jgi:ABC-type multidrug transport system fused ATPase/permease subunit
MSYLQKLQSLPQNTKKRMMWLVIGIIMFFIFCLWFFIFLPKNSVSKSQGENKSLSELKGQLQESMTGFKEVQKQISDLKEQTTEENSKDISNETKESNPRLPLE